MKKYNIGIVGLGYVGSALQNALLNKVNLFTLDINKDSNCNNLKELSENAETIFICLPTPMKTTGECDTTLIEETLKEISKLSKENKNIVIKSTVKPGFTQKIQKEFSNLKLVFNPEFLRELTFKEDFLNQTFIILGGDKKDCIKIKKIYSLIFNNIEYHITTSQTAEMIKYTINNFLATKVSFSNEIFQFCKKIGVNYKDMINIAVNDERLGKSHWSVPGPDGKYGFGGSCFPKDTAALIFEMKKKGVNSYIIKSVVERNINEDRKEKDWEKLIGRAISEKS